VIAITLLVINRDLFRKRIKRVVVKSVSHAVPWREYVLDWGGMVREMECSTAVNSLKASIDVVCKEVGRAREYTLKPIIVIENDNGVLTMLVGA
jgi:hypothetical protein